MNYSDPEDRIKKHIVEILGRHFILRQEVSGTFLVDGSGVRVDFFARPLPHLVERGFDDFWFAIEAKHINLAGDVGKQINQLFWQAITYGQSTFGLHGDIERPGFVLICVDYMPKYGDSKWEQWQALKNFAQYANVGVLALDGAEWLIEFGCTSYYNSRRDVRSKVQNLGTKRYSGNATR